MEQNAPPKKQWITPEVVLLSSDNVTYRKSVAAGFESSYKSKHSSVVGGSSVPYVFFKDGHRVRIGQAATANYFIAGS